MKYGEAKKIADSVKAQLEPHCEKIATIGAIRRKEPEVDKIEIIAILKPYILIPEPYNVGLFESGIEAVLNQWSKIKGELPCVYMQRMLPGGMNLDLHFIEADNWDRVFKLRTSAVYYSHQKQSARRKSASLKVKEGTALKTAENSLTSR